MVLYMFSYCSMNKVSYYSVSTCTEFLVLSMTKTTLLVLCITDLKKGVRGFIKGWPRGKLTVCEHDFVSLLNISKNFF